MGENALTGLLPGGSLSVFLFSESRYNEKWAEAEFITAGLIQGIQPSRHSEGKRKAIIEHIQRLICKHFDCQVCTYGSVPLKTYLSDGDIDLTAFSCLPHSNESWANDLCRILEREEHNRHAKICIKEVQIIHAEVQIVKCLVENVIVDISFNQLGGLCTLCFLEEVDRLIGRDHLFKRSIILVKAWCYYESRILGAYHGLISTYALEILVLYIFNLFHASLRGPFEVLYKFLQFFSQFDWEHFCLSMWGPIRLSALQDMAAEPPQKNDDKLLLSREFLLKCSRAYGVLHVGGQDFQGRIFSSKNMNVMDPLRVNNNLGRSINRGNFFRIRSAFAYGVKQMEKLFRGSPDEFAEKLDEIYQNTRKHCNGYRPNAPAPSLVDVVIPVMANATKDLQEATDCVCQCGDVNSHQNSIIRPDSKKGVASRGRSAFPLVCEASETTRGRLNKTDFSSTNGVSKQTAESMPFASEVTVNSGGNLEDAGDLASCDNGYNGSQEGLGRQADDPPSAAMPSTCYDHPCLIHGSEDTVSTMNSMVDQQSAMHVTSSRNPVILTGDFKKFLSNLQACRLMVTSHFYGPLMFTSALLFPSQHYASEGPGRPTNGDISMFTQVFAYSHGQYLDPLLQGLSLQNAFVLPTNGMFRKGGPKSHRGTGTYLPYLKSGSYMDTQLMGGSKGTTNAAKFLERSDTENQDEANASASRYPNGRARQQGCFNASNFNTRPENSSFKRNSLEKGWRTPQEERPSSYPATTSAANGGSTWGFSSQASDFGPSIVVDANSDGNKLHIGDTYMPKSSTAMAHTYANTNNGFLAESLEFGSLGSPILARFEKAVAHDGVGRDPEVLRLENHQKLKHEDDTKPGEVIAKKVLFDDNPKSSLQCSYELKEEDFPPLSSCRQPRKSTGLNAQKGSANGGRAHFQACFVGSST